MYYTKCVYLLKRLSFVKLLISLFFYTFKTDFSILLQKPLRELMWPTSSTANSQTKVKKQDNFDYPYESATRLASE